MVEKKPLPEQGKNQGEKLGGPEAISEPAAAVGRMPSEEAGRAAAGRLGLDFALLNWHTLLEAAALALESNDQKKMSDVLTVLVRRRSDIVAKMGS
jgi:hypothetical protein